MTTTFGYISPEQQMQDRAEFARKGIARGRSVCVLKTGPGIVFVAENHSSTLHKVSEIYDRIGFAAVGRYHEFESLRIAGIRHADMRGYSYDRADVTGRSLAGAYSQLLGGAFASSVDKPFEVELIVGELGDDVGSDVLYRISYDGVITDERSFSVVGGDAERTAKAIGEGYAPDISLAAAVRLAAASLTPDGALQAHQLEVALLDRAARNRRTFVRLDAARVGELLDA
ncbi:MAG: proteasome subunit alpha [Propionibacterium sp.]|nr:proteasome subunit alpha [Propionibacterium sp.]